MAVMHCRTKFGLTSCLKFQVVIFTWWWCIFPPNLVQTTLSSPQILTFSKIQYDICIRIKWLLNNRSDIGSKCTALSLPSAISQLQTLLIMSPLAATAKAQYTATLPPPGLNRLLHCHRHCQASIHCCTASRVHQHISVLSITGIGGMSTCLSPAGIDSKPMTVGTCSFLTDRDSIVCISTGQYHHTTFWWFQNCQPSRTTYFLMMQHH